MAIGVILSSKNFEQHAQQVIGKTLQREVFMHDDGSRDGLYDLRVGPIDNPEIAIECVRVINPTFAAKYMNKIGQE